MTSTNMSLQQLSVEAERAVAAAAAAKQLVRAAKADLKKARKVSKTAKKAAKLARKKVEAAKAAKTPAVPHPLHKSVKSKSAGAKRAAVARSKPPTTGLQSASQVAKEVITRIAVSGRPKQVVAEDSADIGAVMGPGTNASAAPGFVNAASVAVD